MYLSRQDGHADTFICCYHPSLLVCLCLRLCGGDCASTVDDVYSCHPSPLSCSCVGKLTPFSGSNWLSTSHQLQGLFIPDVLPSSLPPDADFSFCAGEFLEAYSEQCECWDCIITCFFLDTAHNIVDYVEAIERLLVPGGVWLNLGPLLYHYSDFWNDASIELSYEQLRHVIASFGLLIQKESYHQCFYCQHPQSLMTTCYNCVFFKAIKMLDISEAHADRTTAS